MTLSRETLALVAVVASAAALALLTGYAATASPLSGLLGLGSGSATSEPVDLQALKDLVISPAAGAQGKLEETSWLKLTRYSSVNTTKIRLELENIEQLTQYFRYLVIQVREAYEELRGPTTEITDQQSIRGASQSNLELPDYRIDKDDIINKIVDVTEEEASGGINLESFAEGLLEKVAHAYVTVINDTDQNRSRVIDRYGLDKIVDEIKNTADGFAVSLSEEKSVGGQSGYYLLITNSGVLLNSTNPPNNAWEAFYVALSTGGDPALPEKAMNYTLIIEFTDEDGNPLFNFTWTVRWYDENDDGVYENVTAVEYVSSLYPVLVLGNTRATLGFDKPSGWWQPEDTLVVDEDSWRVDGGSAAVYGVTVFYEAREGVLFDSLPVVVNAEVLETS